MATISSILPWRIPWIEEPGGLQPIGSQTVGHDWSNLACKRYIIECFPNILNVELPFMELLKFYRPSDTQLTVWKCVIRNSCFTGCCLLRNKTIHANPLLKAAQVFTLQGPQASSEGNDSLCISADIAGHRTKCFYQVGSPTQRSGLCRVIQITY